MCYTPNMRNLKIKPLHKKAMLPVRITGGSVGFDVSACLEDDTVILPGDTMMIGSGFAMALEPGYAAFLYARSGLGIKHGMVPANCVGVIDSDYRGEVIVGLKNTSKEPFAIRNGDRIAQMVICKCELPELMICDELDDTKRGKGGFGSTGSGL